MTTFSLPNSIIKFSNRATLARLLINILSQARAGKGFAIVPIMLYNNEPLPVYLCKGRVWLFAAQRFLGGVSRREEHFMTRLAFTRRPARIVAIMAITAVL